jgi:hypothetical protein
MAPKGTQKTPATKESAAKLIAATTKKFRGNIMPGTEEIEIGQDGFFHFQTWDRFLGKLFFKGTGKFCMASDICGNYLGHAVAT